MTDSPPPHLCAAPSFRFLHVSPIVLMPSLQSILYGLVGGWGKAQALESQAPAHVTMPTGTRVLVDYSREQPTVSVRIQASA